MANALGERAYGERFHEEPFTSLRSSCDGRIIGNGKPGPITRQLRERFFQMARQ